MASKGDIHLEEASGPTARPQPGQGVAANLLAPGLQGDLEVLNWADGLHVGVLEYQEREALDRLCEAGLARRTYEGVSGVMGLATVRLDRAAIAKATGAAQ